jgi:UDP-galactopyranose mutase
MIHASLASNPVAFDGLKYLVVGSGLFGSVIAERIAQDKGLRVAVIEKRPHLGGNCHSEVDPATGIECHRYGSHIFHTRSERVWHYMNRFCTFNSYRHRVLTRYRGRVFPMPIGLATINEFLGRTLSPSEAEAWLRSEAAKEPYPEPANLEEKAISLVGRPLYEAFIAGYTAKQWGHPPGELPAGVITRLPVRYGYKPDYFDDRWQGIPWDGYAALFSRLLDHPRIDVYPDTDYFDVRDRVPAGCRIVYTGPVDRFHDYRYGRLRWRSLSFEREVVPVRDFQGTAVMNYAEESVPFTRIHEFRHYHEERDYPADRSVIVREYPGSPADGEEPCYPVDTAGDRETLSRYAAANAGSDRVIFGGRLGSYRYLDMDRAVESALETYDTTIRHAGETA